MTFLTVLVLMVGVFVVMVAGFLGLSYALGTYFRSHGGARVSAADKDPCAQCNADRDWHYALPLWKQNLVSVWWWANRIRCGAKGCE